MKTGEEIITTGGDTRGAKVRLDNGMIARIEFKENDISDVGLDGVGRVLMGILFGTDGDGMGSRTGARGSLRQQIWWRCSRSSRGMSGCEEKVEEQEKG